MSDDNTTFIKKVLFSLVSAYTLIAGSVNIGYTWLRGRINRHG